MSQSTDPSKLNEDEGSAEVFFQPMGFTDILDSTFSLYRNHFRLFVKHFGRYMLYLARCSFLHVNSLVDTRLLRSNCMAFGLRRACIRQRSSLFRKANYNPYPHFGR